VHVCRRCRQPTSHAPDCEIGMLETLCAALTAAQAERALAQDTAFWLNCRRKEPSDEPRGADVCGLEGTHVCALCQLADAQAAQREAEQRTLGWEDTARQYALNVDYYRDIVTEIGELFGDEAKTAADGVGHDDVLRAKVPDLVRSLRQRADAAEALARRLRGALECVELVEFGGRRWACLGCGAAWVETGPLTASEKEGGKVRIGKWHREPDCWAAKVETALGPLPQSARASEESAE